MQANFTNVLLDGQFEQQRLQNSHKDNVLP